MKKLFDRDASYQPGKFEFRNQKKVKEIISRYPKGRQRSAVMPLLDLAQRQMAEDGAKAEPPYGGWIPAKAMDEVARIIDEHPVHVLEVATFYSMFNLTPVGKYLIQICTTTPCWLQGSDSVLNACRDRLGIEPGETTEDGLFTLMEVECLGSCVSAPVVQINDDYYEDVSGNSMIGILDALIEGRKPKTGSQMGRKSTMPMDGPTSLTDLAKQSGV
jgi:NADH-quinone oxidoreductase subunit E